MNSNHRDRLIQDRFLGRAPGPCKRAGEGWALFIVENKGAQLRTVEIERRNGLVVEIVRVLAKNEPVIVHPDDRLKEGSRVRIE